MNLMDMQWIPIRCHSGKTEWIAPWQLTSDYASDPVVEIAATRPDFRGALAQFFIGLLQTTMPPEKTDEWRRLLEDPPSSQELQKCLGKVRHVFELDGEGPAFMQDFDLEGAEVEEVSALLIDAPGEQTLKRNLDHFNKGGQVSRICERCAATALFTLQTNAPAGGAGYRTSLRGGGPMTTLVQFDPAAGRKDSDTLWRNIWLNVLTKSTFERLCGDPGKSADSDVFPWMGKTRTSEKGGSTTTPLDVHPLQIYWAMPRRIRLLFENTGDGVCDICGQSADAWVTGYKTRNYGVNYEGAWRHPLSPYYRDKEKSLRPLHPNKDGIPYRHWAGLVMDAKNVEIAAAMKEFLNRWERSTVQIRLWAFGYDMDNMKARGWHESVFPLVGLSMLNREDYVQYVVAMVGAADETSRMLQYFIKDAWFERPGDARGDLSHVGRSFWSDTEPDFYTHLALAYSAVSNGSDISEILTSWHQRLVGAATRLFTLWTLSGGIEFSDSGRVSRAYRKLRGTLEGKRVKGLLQGAAPLT